MGQMDWEKERQRLAKVYSGMEDAELQEVAKDSDSLTEVAREALQFELTTRGLSSLPPKAEGPPGNQRSNEPPAPVVVRRFRDLPEASIAKSILDSAGIESSLADDNLVRLDWFYSNLVGGIKLLVRQEDAEDAEAAIKLLDESTPERFEVEGVGEFVQPRCPKCNSMDVSLDGLDKRTSYATLIVGLPIPITEKGWKCHRCGHAWQEDNVGERAASPKEEPKKDQ